MPDPKKYRTYKPYQQVQHPSDSGPVNYRPAKNPYQSPESFPLATAMVIGEPSLGGNTPLNRDEINRYLSSLTPAQRKEFDMWAKKEMENAMNKARELHLGSWDYVTANPITSDYRTSMEEAAYMTSYDRDRAMYFKELLDSMKYHNMGLRNVPEGEQKPWVNSDVRRWREKPY